MVAYEGGYSPDLAAAGSTNTDIFRGASKNCPRIRDYTIAVYNAFTSVSDGTFTAYCPSQFNLGEDTNFNGGTPTGAWGALVDIYAATDSPAWLAIKAYNAARRANPLRLRLHA